MKNKKEMIAILLILGVFALALKSEISEAQTRGAPVIRGEQKELHAVLTMPLTDSNNYDVIFFNEFLKSRGFLISQILDKIKEKQEISSTEIICDKEGKCEASGIWEIGSDACHYKVTFNFKTPIPENKQGIVINSCTATGTQKGACTPITFKGCTLGKYTSELIVKEGETITPEKGSEGGPLV